MAPKTILHVITTLEADGAQTQLLGIVRRIDPEKYRILIAYLARRPEAVDGSLPPFVTVHDLSRGGRFDPFVLFRLARLMRREHVDLVHTHLVHAGILGKLAARLAAVRCVITTRHYGYDFKRRSFLYRLEDRLTSRCTLVIAVSQSVREYLISHRIIDPERVVVIPNGVDVALFDPGRFPPLARGEDETVIGSVGRLHPQKGLDILLSAYALVLGQYPKTQLEIVGDGPLRGALEAQARDLGISGQVAFVGRVAPREIPARLVRWDLFALPSRWEGFGIAIAEAMAMGLPVVASNVEGIRELITEGENGLLVEPEGASALADSIGMLVSDPGYRKRLGSNARKQVVESLAIDRVASRIDELYSALLGR